MVIIHLKGGTNCTPVGIQFFVTQTHFFDVLLGISTIGQDFNDINDREKPLFFFIVPDRTNEFVSEKFQGR